MRQLSIQAETLSAGSPVAQQLIERGVQVQAANLTAGNYLITGTCAILHVSLADFSNWIANKTIFRRITEFKRAVKEPVVLIEGVANGERTVSPSALRAALAFVAVHNRVPVLFSSDVKESADLIYAMVNQVQNGMGLTLDATSVASVESVAEAAKSEGDAVHDDYGNGNGNGNASNTIVTLPERIVQMIPEIGPLTARALLKRFGNLRGVFSANVQDLIKIEGIGPKKAKKIASFFSRRDVR